MPIGRSLCALFLLAMPACSDARVGDPAGEVGGSPSDAGGDGGDDDGPGGEVRPDASGGAPDGSPAPPVDAGLIRLTQSDSLDVVGFTSVACFEAINSYYRVFNLPAEGITGPIQIDKVTFGVEECVSGSGGLEATVVLHRLDGPLRLAGLTQLARQETIIPDVAEPGDGVVGGLLHEVPMSAEIPAGTVLVVEVTHAGLDADQTLLMGANTADQDGPTYLRAPECNTNEPTDADTIENEDGDRVTMHWVLVIDGRGR